MTGTWQIVAISLLALQGATAAQAAARCNPRVDPPQEDPNEIICVTVARFWSGSGEDVRDIETVPVPASFISVFNPALSCRHVTPQSFTSWHLAFGSERSTMAGLAYLAQNILPSMPAPGDYLARLRRAWRDAQADLNCARLVQQPEGASYSAQWAYMDRSRAISQLREHIGARYYYQVIAGEYLRAAEEFRSARLLDEAEIYLQPLLESAEFLAPLEAAAPAGGLLHFNLETFKTDDLRMRAAILRARISGSSADADRAVAVVRGFERPFYRDAGWGAYGGGGGFCDMRAGGGTAQAALEAECGNDHALQERVTHYWINRATLDALSNPEDRAALELSLHLLEREEVDSPRCCWRSTSEDELRIRWARAEASTRLFHASREAPDGNADLEAWREAMEELQRAERLIHVPEAPGRFRRIAEAWLALWEQAATLDQADPPGPSLAATPHHRRYAAYLRTLIANLDAVAVGAGPGGS